MFCQKGPRHVFGARGDKAMPALQRPLRQGRKGIYVRKDIHHRSILPAISKAPTGLTMQDDDGKGAKQDRRQDRLKLALRENLKRRKSQARGRGDLAASSNIEDPSPYDDGASKPGK
jgi:hypothetical protein